MLKMASSLGHEIVAVLHSQRFVSSMNRLIASGSEMDGCAANGIPIPNNV